MPIIEGHRVGWNNARILETAGIENIRNQPIWYAKPISSANPVWTFSYLDPPHHQ
jgi:hypothetical protein